MWFLFSLALFFLSIIALRQRFFLSIFISRPPWTPEMSVEELDANEKQAFLNWRRMLVRLAFFVLPHLNFTSSVCYKQINICHQIVCW